MARFVPKTQGGPDPAEYNADPYFNAMKQTHNDVVKSRAMVAAGWTPAAGDIAHFSGPSKGDTVKSSLTGNTNSIPTAPGATPPAGTTPPGGQTPPTQNPPPGSTPIAPTGATGAGGATGTTGGKGPGPGVSSNLAPGSSGPEVQKLQQWLVSQGYMSQADMATGPGTYGPRTKAAVAKWQQSANLDTKGNSGYFGPISRSYFNQGAAGAGAATPINQGNNPMLPATDPNAPVSNYVGGLGQQVNDLTAQLQSQYQTQSDNYKQQMDSMQAHFDSVMAQEGAIASTEMQQKQDALAQEKQRFDQNYNTVQGLATNLQSLMTQGNELIKQQTNTTGLASIRDPRTQQTMSDIAAAAGVIQAGISVFNGQMSQAQNQLSSVNSAITSTYSSQLDYYNNLANFYDKGITTASANQKEYIDAQINLTQQKLASAQATYDNVQKAMTDPATALLYAQAGVTLNDSVDQINQKLAAQSAVNQTKDQTNYFGQQGYMPISQAELAGKQANGATIGSFVDSQGQTHYFAKPAPPSAFKVVNGVLVNTQTGQMMGLGGGGTGGSGGGTGGGQPQTATYSIKAGEDPYNIAKQNGLSMDEFKTMNPQISDWSKVMPGTALNVPAASFKEYGLLSKTDFNPNSSADQNAKNYLDTYLKSSTGAMPTAASLFGSSRGAAQAQFVEAQNRAKELFYNATGQELPDLAILKSNKALITGNNKLLNNLKMQEGTVGANFKLAVENLDKSGLNQNSQPINGFLDSIKNMMGDPNVAQYLTQNGTVQNEVGNLISIKNASGTTVADKLASAGLIPKNASVDQQKRILSVLLQEAENGQNAINSASANLYSLIDPLQTDPSNPNNPNSSSFAGGGDTGSQGGSGDFTSTFNDLFSQYGGQ